MPPTPSGSYEVAAGERAVYIRVHGLGSMNNCLCVRDFLDGMIKAGRAFVVFDLGDCAGMDSTFLGVIAGAATATVDQKPVGVAIVNAADRLVRLLEEVGLLEMVFVEVAPFAPPELEFHRLEEQATETERINLIRRAHRRLIEISPKNEAVFGPLVRAIEDEMRGRGLPPV